MKESKIEFVREENSVNPSIKFPCPNCGKVNRPNPSSSWRGTEYSGKKCYECGEKIELKAVIEEQ